MNRLKIELVDDAANAWRWLSMRAMALDAAFLLAWPTLPDDLKAALPSWLVTGSAVMVLFIGMVGRVIKQKGPTNE